MSSSKESCVAEIDTFLTNISLYFDEELCNGCGICEDVCPKEAIRMGPTGAISKAATELPSLIVDGEECVLCGVCDAVCPFRAFRLEVDGKQEVPIVDLEGFPRFLKYVELSVENCNLCNTCAMICPVRAIRIEDLEIDVDINRCITCFWCEDICVSDAIEVSPPIDGEIEIDPTECPGGCAVCIETCPTDAIYEPESKEPWGEVDRIAVDNRYCICCGACANACPVEGAIKVDRNKVRVESIKSMIWDWSQEKLEKEIKSGT